MNSLERKNRVRPEVGGREGKSQRRCGDSSHKQACLQDYEGSNFDSQRCLVHAVHHLQGIRTDNRGVVPRAQRALMPNSSLPARRSTASGPGIHQAKTRERETSSQPDAWYDPSATVSGRMKLDAKVDTLRRLLNSIAFR